MMDAIEVLPAPGHSRARLAAAQFLSAYTGNTLAAYTKDLQILFDWCRRYGLDPLAATRPHLELFGRHLAEERGNKPPSVHRRLSTVKCFYRMAAVDDVISKSPAEHLRLPRLFPDEAQLRGLERLELGAIILQARRTDPCEEALVALMGLMGLRVSEACSVLVEKCQTSTRGHRLVEFTGKGGKPASVPLAIPVARAVDQAIDDRTSGPLLLRRDGRPMDRRYAARVVARLGRKVGIDFPVTPHMFRHAYVGLGLDAGVALRDMQIGARHADPRTTARYDVRRRDYDKHPNYILAAFIAGAA